MNETTKRKEQVAYLHGRLDQQIEIWAERFGWNYVELGTHLGAILIGAPINSLSGSKLSKSKARKGSTTLEEVEVAGGTHVGRASGKWRRGRPSKTSPRKVSPFKGKKQTWWYKLSKKEQAAVIAKRVAGTKKAKAGASEDQAKSA